MAWEEGVPLPLLFTDGTNNYIYGPENLPIEQISSGGTVLYHVSMAWVVTALGIALIVAVCFPLGRRLGRLDGTGSSGQRTARRPRGWVLSLSIVSALATVAFAAWLMWDRGDWNTLVVIAGLFVVADLVILFALARTSEKRILG
jgi:di/tricarboxylate transporter